MRRTKAQPTNARARPYVCNDLAAESPVLCPHVRDQQSNEYGALLFVPTSCSKTCPGPRGQPGPPTDEFASFFIGPAVVEWDPSAMMYVDRVRTLEKVARWGGGCVPRTDKRVGGTIGGPEQKAALCRQKLVFVRRKSCDRDLFFYCTAKPAACADNDKYMAVSWLRRQDKFTAGSPRVLEDGEGRCEKGVKITAHLYIQRTTYFYLWPQTRLRCRICHITRYAPPRRGACDHQSTMASVRVKIVLSGRKQTPRPV